MTGCTKISPGCKHCYAERMANRLQAMRQPRYKNGFEVTLQHDQIELPLKWKLPRIIFVNSMSDLFHEAVPNDFIHKCFDVMNRAGQHTFQILTKRTERLVDMSEELSWTPNIWMGTSIETAQYAWRAKLLSKVSSAVRFLSVEPLLGPIPRLPLTRIDWVIVGGESGPGARSMREEWVTQIRDRCHIKGVPFFFKQWGGVRKSNTGRDLEGRTWDQMPHHNGRANAEEKRSLAGTLQAR